MNDRLVLWLLGFATGLAFAMMLQGPSDDRGGGGWKLPAGPIGPLVMEDLRTH